MTAHSPLRSNKTTLFSLLFVVVLTQISCIGAFAPKCSITTSTRPETCQAHATVCFVKKFTPKTKTPPKTGKYKTPFDLDAIEAFETELDVLEQKESDDADGINSGDDAIDSSNQSAAVADVQVLKIPADLNKKRIDAALAELMEPELSRSACGAFVVDGRVHRISDDGEDGELIDRKSFKVETGMAIRVSLPQDEIPTEIVAQDLPIDILFEDEHMIVLNKAAHMVVHPATGNWDGTVVNALAYYLPRSTHGRGDFVDEEGKPITTFQGGDDDDDDNQKDGLDDETVSFRPGIVHRLDKGTTGVLVVAKTSRALSLLSRAFADRRVSKTYLAVTVGNPGNNVKIEKPIGRHPVNRQKMRVVPDPHQSNTRKRMAQQPPKAPSVAGRRALSYVDSLAFDSKLALVRVKIETGRTHQIRVHLQDRHTPIYGDEVYGLPDWNKRLIKTHQIRRPLLHAYKLNLEHPITGEQLHFTAPLDSDMMKIATTIVPPGSEYELSELLDWK